MTRIWTVSGPISGREGKDRERKGKEGKGRERREAEEKRGRGEETQRRGHLAANACGRREVKRF